MNGQNAIVRRVPRKPWHASDAVTMLLGGALPFAASSIELGLLVSCVWNQRIYSLCAAPRIESRGRPQHMTGTWHWSEDAYANAKRDAYAYARDAWCNGAMVGRSLRWYGVCSHTVQMASSLP